MGQGRINCAVRDHFRTWFAIGPHAGRVRPELAAKDHRDQAQERTGHDQADFRFTRHETCSSPSGKMCYYLYAMRMPAMPRWGVAWAGHFR